MKLTKVERLALLVVAFLLVALALTAHRALECSKAADFWKQQYTNATMVKP